MGNNIAHSLKRNKSTKKIYTKDKYTEKEFRGTISFTTVSKIPLNESY